MQKNNTYKPFSSNSSNNGSKNSLFNTISKYVSKNVSKNGPKNGPNNGPKNVTSFTNKITKYFKNNNSIEKSMSSNNIGNKFSVSFVLTSICILILVSIIIYLSVCYYNFYNKECYEKKTFLDYVFDFYSNDICIKETAPIPEIPKELPPTNNSLMSILEDNKEVFHIANQDYTYEQSKCKCESYGGRLATKSELTDAYNNGANWCTYGWTEKQSAYYPVQQCEWDKINKGNERLPKHAKQYCGLPGVNGGYFANPQLKFGINCYGIKPKGQTIKAKKPYCPPMNFCKLENNFEASHKLDTDEIVSFNNDKWNQNI